VFNVDSEAYLALLSFVPRADALAAWRVPVTILGMLLLFCVFRQWLGRPAAVAGVVVTAGTTFYLAKFDAYKPEALGIVVGLAALWLVVRGLRGRRRSWILLAGASMGVGLSIHAIAATVMGLFIAGFAGAEWLVLRRERLPRLGWLVRAAALGFLISVVMGAGVQGRAIVASAALNPTTIGGADPTWTFFLRSSGDFSEPEPPPPQRPLAGGVTSPWAGFRVTSAFGWWLLPVVGVGRFKDPLQAERALAQGRGHGTHGGARGTVHAARAPHQRDGGEQDGDIDQELHFRRLIRVTDQGVHGPAGDAGDVLAIHGFLLQQQADQPAELGPVGADQRDR